MAVNFTEATNALELCRFAYKMYAQSVKFPFDPFFEADLADHSGISTRSRMMSHIHDELLTSKADAQTRELDPIEYRLDVVPNPQNSTIYRGDTDNTYLLFTPGTWDKKIGQYNGYDIKGQIIPGGTVSGGTATCSYFQGGTGTTVNHPNRLWTSWMGAAIHDSATSTVYITFRGSRSGNGVRSLAFAQLFSKGNPDWITDMNHLKTSTVHEVAVGDVNKEVKLSAGFWKAYVHSRKSLEAAYKNVSRGRSVQRIVITGHSLGGALAQCAYIDFSCGQMRRNLGLDGANVELSCYPISAPPVCAGLTTQHWISRHADVANVHHYYCPYDAVHASPLVKSGGATKGNVFINFLTHPTTTTYHIGSEIALDSTTTFPDAHEPYDVWKAMWKETSQPQPADFWQEVLLDLKKSEVSPTNKFDTVQKDQLLKALVDSFDFEQFMKRARDWADGISKKVEKDAALSAINAISLAYSNEAYLDVSNNELHTQDRLSIRKTLSDVKRSTGSDTAKCVYHTLTVATEMQRFLRTNNAFTPTKYETNQTRRVGQFKIR